MGVGDELKVEAHMTTFTTMEQIKGEKSQGGGDHEALSSPSPHSAAYTH